MTPGQNIVDAMHAAAVCRLAHRDIRRCVVCGFDSDNIGEAVAHLRQHEEARAYLGRKLRPEAVS